MFTHIYRSLDKRSASRLNKLISLMRYAYQGYDKSVAKDFVGWAEFTKPNNHEIFVGLHAIAFSPTYDNPCQ